jgi:hypothetical protein
MSPDMFPISNPGKDPSLQTGASSIYSAGDIEMRSVCLPNPSKSEIFLRLQHAELRESLTGAILLLPSPLIYQGMLRQQ